MDAVGRVRLVETMCENAGPSDWTAFHFLNCQSFPWVDSSRPVYAILEACDRCSDVRARRVDPQTFPLVESTDASLTPDTSTSETTDKSVGSDDGVRGVDLENPEDLNREN